MGLDHVVIVESSESVFLREFLQAMRRRLWLVQIQADGRKVFFYVSFLLLFLAAVHRLIIPLTPMAIIFVVAIPTLWILGRVLFRRPTLAYCAARADHEFRGQALMTTAAECLSDSGAKETFAARTVLKQAEIAAASWRPRVPTSFNSPPTSITTLAVIPLFMAMVLFSLPVAKTTDDVVQQTIRGAALDASDEIEGSNPIDDDVAMIRSIVADEAKQDATLASAREENNTAVFEATNAEDAGDHRSTLPDEARTQAGEAPTSKSDGDLPGTSASRTTLDPDGLAPPANFQSRENILLQRRGFDVSSGADPGKAYSAIDLWEANIDNTARPAASAESLTQWTVLSPAQAAHARRYLTESRNAND